MSAGLRRRQQGWRGAHRSPRVPAPAPPAELSPAPPGPRLRRGEAPSGTVRVPGPCRLLADRGAQGRNASPGPRRAIEGTKRPAGAPRCLRRRTRAPSRCGATPAPPRGREGELVRWRGSGRGASANRAGGGLAVTSTSRARGTLTRAGSAPRPRGSLALRARENGSGRALPADASDASLLPGGRGLAQDHAYSIREKHLQEAHQSHRLCSVHFLDYSSAPTPPPPLASCLYLQPPFLLRSSPNSSTTSLGGSLASNLAAWRWDP